MADAGRPVPLRPADHGAERRRALDRRCDRPAEAGRLHRRDREAAGRPDRAGRERGSDDARRRHGGDSRIDRHAPAELGPGAGPAEPDARTVRRPAVGRAERARADAVAGDADAAAVRLQGGVRLRRQPAALPSLEADADRADRGPARHHGHGDHLRSEEAVPGRVGTLKAVVAAGAAAAAWGVLVERELFAIRTARLPLLPPGSPDVTVLHLSDLHMAPWQRHKQRFVRELADLEPDLVVDTGDNLGHPLGLLGLRAAFEPFRLVPGVHVHGSNDYWAPVPKNPLRYFAGPSAEPPVPRRLDTAALDAFLGELGWTDLNNRVARLTIKGVPVDLIGVNDPHRGYDRPDELAAPLAGLRADGPPAALTLGVAHAPYRRVLDDFTDRGADLLLAGHTHGGQV